MTVSIKIICIKAYWSNMAERIDTFQRCLSDCVPSFPEAVLYWKDDRFAIVSSRAPEHAIDSSCTIAEIKQQFLRLCDSSNYLISKTSRQETELAVYTSIPEMLADEKKVFIVVNVW